MEYNEYELVSLAQEGNEDAINLLYKRYQPIIVSKSRQALNYMKNSGIDINDIMQEGYIGFEEAINSFNQDNNTSFYTFANICIDREIYNYSRLSNAVKSRPLNDAINIDDDFGKNLKDDINIEDNIVNDNFKESRIQKIDKYLTKFEREVFNLILKGFSFGEIAKACNKDLKSIYNTFNRIKLKAQKIDYDN